MIPVSTILACIVTLLISLVLPLVLLAVLAVKYKRQGILSAWLLGAAGFFVPQILIRLPVLSFLQTQSWFSVYSQMHPFLYSFSLAFTAGLFELAGRFASALLMRKNLTSTRSLAAGLGHGGIEAILLVGMTYVNNLLYIFMINSGSFDALLLSAAGNELVTAQLELIRTQFLSVSPGLFLLGGLERLLTMICQLAMSMLICYGVVHKKGAVCTMLCLGIHTFLDLTAGLSLVLPQNAAYPVIYTILIAAAAVSVFLVRDLFRRWQKMEVCHAEAT